MLRLSRCLRLALLSCWAQAILGGQTAAPASPPPSDSVRLTADWNAAQFLPAPASRVFTLNRPLLPSDGRLVVIVDRSDLTPLLDIDGTSVRLPLRGEGDRIVA